MDIRAAPRTEPALVHRSTSVHHTGDEMLPVRKPGYGAIAGGSMLEKSVVGVIVIAALYFGSELFVPLAISVLLAFSLSPVVKFLRRPYVSQWLAVTATVLLAFAIIFMFGAIVTTQVTELGTELPRYQVALKEKVRAINNFTGGKGGAIDRASNTLRDLQKELEKGSADNQSTLQPRGAETAKTGAVLRFEEGPGFAHPALTTVGLPGSRAGRRFVNAEVGRGATGRVRGIGVLQVRHHHSDCRSAVSACGGRGRQGHGDGASGPS